MPRAANKRKEKEEVSGDETLPARQEKAQRTSRNTVEFGDTVHTVNFSKQQPPKSILKARSTPFPTASRFPDAVESPSPEVPEQPEQEEFDKEEADGMSKLAADAIKLAKHIQKEQLQHNLAEAQKELAFTKDDLELVRFGEKIITQSRDKAVRALADANKRAETAEAEANEALLASGRLKNKVKSLEGLVKRANEQAEKLQRELAVAVAEKAEMEILLREKTAKETAEAGNVVSK